jgi:hypothetical protein
MERDLAADRTALRRLVNGYQASQALHAVATLGVADALAAGPRSAEDLAGETGTHADALYRVLRAVAALGVLEEQPGGRFALTPLGDGLRSDAPMSVAGWATQIGQPYYWEAWAHLADSVRTGENAFRLVHGTDVWTYRSTWQREQEIFNRAMESLSAVVVAAVVGAYDFSRFGRVVDVGGGYGSLLAAILARHPAMRGVLFDLPGVVAGAGDLQNRAGVADRCETVGGSFFEEVPAGADAYMLKSVLHDWRDAEAAQILLTCARAMGPDTVLLAVERVVGPPNEDADAKLSDLNMLVAAGGVERTQTEWQSLLAAAGLKITQILPTRSGFSVIEASKTN